MLLWELLQLCKSRFQKRLHSLPIPARPVVKRRRHLNQPLQKRLIRLACRQPDFFPNLVRLEELAGVEKLDPSLEL